ncbi:MAG TPA: iron ABC transporter permease [Acidimicrobiales bacterium]|nr:iron ABC transporter permease [Acidimicrobiales bacterium]
MGVTTARRTPAGLAFAGAVVAGVTVLPLVYLVLRAVGSSDPLALVGSERVVRFVWATLRLGVVVGALALFLGVGLAWLVERTDLPGRRFLGVAAVLPLVVPSYVAALALKAAFGPAGLLAEIPGVIGFWGAATALGMSSYPYVLLMARAALAAGDPALEEAARSLGDSRARAFRRVLLPQLRPAMAAGTLLVFLYVLSDFGAVSILQYDTLTRGIFLEYRSLSPDRSPAAVLGVVLVILTLVAITTERLARGRTAPARAVAGAAPPIRVSLGRWRWVAAGGVVAVVAAGLGVPVGVLGYWSAVGSSRASAGGVLADAAMTSMLLAGAAALVAVVAAVPVALLAVRHRTRFARAVETLSFSGYALPGLVIALALVFFAAPYPLYQTLSLVVLAYVIRFLPEAIGSVRSSLGQVDPALEEVARSLGRGRLATTATVTLPLVRRGLLAGGALVFLTAMKELPATLVLRPPGTDTLAVRVWTGASEGLYAQAAPAALILVVVSALVLWPLNWRGAR